MAEALQDAGHQTLLLISEKEIDARAAADHPALAFRTVPAIGMPRVLSPRLLPFLLKFWRTLRLTREIVREFRPEAVLGMGGFTSLPPAMAGRKVGARTYIHESNAIPGKANRLTARFCDVVLLGLDAAALYFPGRECRVVGTPLRASLRRPADRTQAAAFFGLEPQRRTLLVMGGSQGARGINDAVAAEMPALAALGLQLIHLTGREDEPAVRQAAERAGIRAFVAPFSARLDLAYALADLSVARSGASSLAELSYFGIPSILVPYPLAADDHQTANARAYSEKGAALLLPQRDLEPGRLSAVIAGLLEDAHRLQVMSAEMRALGSGEAAEKIAALIASAPAAGR